ncbi:MAG: hypothetical protein H0U70_13120 [Tatlockia sp.]|nr:hypothetical protein [Tatlockia sp.]
MRNTSKALCLILYALASGVAMSSNSLISEEGLPLRVDAKTELNNIELKDMTVVYTYELKNINLEKALSFKNNQRVYVERNACNDSDVKQLLNKDLAVRFVYKMDSDKILEVCIDKKFCQENIKHKIYA